MPTRHRACVLIPPCAHTCAPVSPRAPGVGARQTEGRWKAYGGSMWPCIFMGCPPSTLILQLAPCLCQWQSKPGPPDRAKAACMCETPMQTCIQNSLSSQIIFLDRMKCLGIISIGSIMMIRLRFLTPGGLRRSRRGVCGQRRIFKNN